MKVQEALQNITIAQQCKLADELAKEKAEQEASKKELENGN